MKLRYILSISFLLACGLPLLVFWLWPLSRALEAELARAHERHLVLAQAAAETLEVYQENVEASFLTIVESVRQNRDISHAETLLKAQAFSHFCVVDVATGDVLRAFGITAVHLPERLPPVLLTELRRRVDQGTPHLSEVWIGPGGRPQFLMVERLDDKLVFASVNSAFLQRIADSVVFGQGGHMAVIDAAGRVIAHPDPAWVDAVKDLSTIREIAGLLAREEPEVLRFFSPALQEEVVAGAAPVGNSDWRVLVPQPVSEVRATVIAGREQAALVFAAGLALSAIVALVTASIISRPLRAVASAADAMANGTEGIVVGPLPRGAPAELRALRRSFDTMARRIESNLARITQLASEDHTTGLLNKRAFEQAATAWLRTGDDSRGFTLLHIDLNNLKRINDIYGHAAGDAAIRGIARCLQKIFPAPSLVGRVGGDEFLVLTTYRHDCCLRSRLIAIVEGQVIDLVNGQSTLVSCSVGVTHAPEGSVDINLMISQADEAMYFAKKRASGLQIYDEAMHARTRRRIDLASLLRQDVADDRIEAVFQPIVCAETSEIVSFEALARWRTESEGDVDPSEFLAVAQEAGILSDLDQGVRRQAFALARALRDQGYSVPIAVNVTAPDLARADFAQRFDADMANAGLGSGDVVVEVTETVFHDPCGLAIETLGRLAERGVAVQLDDFGKGFSAHGLLPLCSFQAVKIDLHFAGDPVRDQRAGAIVGSLARLGSELGLAVTLEGIETVAHRAFARAHGVERVQGYLYSRPMDADGAIAAMAKSVVIRAVV